MKKRIVALILVAVMSILSLVSCIGGFNFADEDLSKYATFNYAEFKEKLANIEIEDGDFTTNEETRKKKVIETIYTALADAIIAAAYDSDKLYAGELSDRDVLYYVYYAEDEATGNVYFTSEMQESAITASATKDKHVIKLGGIDLEDDDADKLLKKIKENLAEGDLADFVYSMLTKDDITEDATAAIKEENKDATEAQIKEAVDKALTVKEGDKIVISYSKSYPKVDGETSTVVNESAAYETIVLDKNDPFHAKFLDEDSVAMVGGNLAVFDSIDENGNVKTTQTVLVKVPTGEGEDSYTNYTYTNVKILWKVENAGAPIATFKHTPYTTSNSVTPDNVRSSTAGKVDLKDVELTYYVFPVYYLDVPAHEEITASTVLNYVYGSKLVESSFEVFGEDYKNGEKKIADLVAEIAKIYDTSSEDNEYYAEGKTLKNLLVAYNNAKTLGGSKPSTAEQALIDEALEELTKEQRKESAAVVEKIVAATKDGKTAGEAILEEYNEDTYHSLKETYDTDITEKVQAAVWKLIEEGVKVTAYPEKLVESYEKHLYDTYEYNYFKGEYDSKTSNYDKYDSFEAYLVATLEIKNASEIDAAITAEAKAAVETMIKVFVVAKACEADALNVLPGFIDSDIAAGAYDVDEDSYRDTYGDDADEKIEEAKKSAEENIASAKEDATKFIINNDYMKSYRKEIGRAYYKSLVSEHGEDNLRTSFQFNKLFYYLTSTNLEKSEEGGHHHSEVKYVTREDGAQYLDFRTISYKLVEADEDAED